MVLQRLPEYPRMLTVTLEESKDLYIGQSLDLHWTSNLVCPSAGEYLRALDNSTHRSRGTE